jgi:UDP-2-acetamido-3-amino-2,3-dideoxy-glucuronate N-acetyltransferase
LILPDLEKGEVLQNEVFKQRSSMTRKNFSVFGVKQMKRPIDLNRYGGLEPASTIEADGHELKTFIHSTAEVSGDASFGEGCRIWNQAQIRERASLGKQCIVGKDVYIDRDVIIGDYVKIQNQAQLFRGVVLESGVFIGPRVCFTNDFFPRAINPDGTLKTDDDWELELTFVSYGASIGAGAIILPGVKIGTYAMIGAGAIVTKNVGDHELVVGTPARHHGYVCRCGNKLQLNSKAVSWNCKICRENYFFN